MEFGESRSPRLALAYGTEHRETSVRNDDKMTAVIMITESDKLVTTEPRVVIEADSRAPGKFEVKMILRCQCLGLSWDASNA